MVNVSSPYVGQYALVGKAADAFRHYGVVVA